MDFARHHRGRRARISEARAGHLGVAKLAVLGWRRYDDQPVLFPFWGLCHVACRILVPDQGSKL